MEYPFIKLNDLSPLISLLIEKIQLLDSDIFTKQQKLDCTKEMLEVVDSLREFFAKATSALPDGPNKIFVEKIERAFSHFEWNTSVAVSPLEFEKFSGNGKLLISSLLKLLGLKGCGLLIIETYMKLCLKTVNKMKENIDNEDLSLDKSNFKLLLDGFSSTANMLKKYWHNAFSSDQKNTIMLCLYQICNVLPYLLKMIELKNLDLKKYLLNLLTKCLIKIQSEIHIDGKSLNSKTNGENFIMMMDFCLYKLNELSSCTNDFSSFIERAKTDVSVLKPIIDEILYSVMSVAQVTTFEEDYQAVLASSQKVLREFAELNKEIEEENASAIRLNASSVGESLCNLEQKINNTVLKLVLEVFSNVNSPLKNILNKCRMDITKDNKASEDLNVLITEFDAEMDRIMQIGFFAISCTTSLNRTIGIQSCLASLESLETELIISLTALYVDCNAKNKTNFQWLFDFWLNEITKLKILIDSVLDPAGFCGVAKNQIKSLRLAFLEDTSNSCLDTLSCNLKKTVRYSKKLIKTLRTNMEDEKGNKATDEYLTKFHLAIQECEAVLDLMKEGKDMKKIFNQAVKRYDFLVQTLEKLSSHLFLLVTDEESVCEEKESFQHETSFSKVMIPQKNYYQLCEPSDLTPTTNKAVPEILTPYINTGILRSKRRNVLYTTPEQVNKNENELDKTLPQTRYWDKTPVSNKRSRCCKPLTFNLELENTVDLEMTTIFENISKLSDTFSKTVTESHDFSVKSSKKEKPSCSKDVACGPENSSESLKPTYTSSGCCTQFHLEENEKNENKEEFKHEKSLLGSQLRNRFLQTLKDLSNNDSLLVASDRESSSYVDSPDRINDLKLVDEKINFLKTRMPPEHN